MRKLLRAVEAVSKREEPWPGLEGLNPQRLPCCTWVGLVLLTAHELGADWPEWATDPTWGPVSPWWSAMNVWDASRRWSSVEAMADFGRVVEQLSLGCLHGVQLWGGSKGHTVLVLALPEGAVLVFDSMESRGFRQVLWGSWAGYLEELEQSWRGEVEWRGVSLVGVGRG